MRGEPHGGIRSKTFKPGGMRAQGGRPSAKMAIVGWKADGSSSEPAYSVYESVLPISPPNTRLMQTAQRFRTASPPLAAFDRNWRASPSKRTAVAVKPMNGTKPEPDALRQSAQ